jgi:hypothetical protein
MNEFKGDLFGFASQNWNNSDIRNKSSEEVSNDKSPNSSDMISHSLHEEKTIKETNKIDDLE